LNCCIVEEKNETSLISEAKPCLPKMYTLYDDVISLSSIFLYNNYYGYIIYIVIYDTFIIGTIGIVCCVCSQTANRKALTAGRDTKSGATRLGTTCPTNTTCRCSVRTAVTTVTLIWSTIGTRRTSGCARARRSAAAAARRRTA